MITNSVAFPNVLFHIDSFENLSL